MENNTQPKKYKFAFLIWLFIYPVFTLLSKSLMPLMTEKEIPSRHLLPIKMVALLNPMILVLMKNV
jgi:antibiotic biosynthesis monooxygenase (ABM) superfamily enzyme